MKQGALAICQAILFVKQHSVNCIAAALYAMTCFDAALFPPEEAEVFTAQLFGPPPDSGGIPRNCRVHPSASPDTTLPAEDQAQIKSHILSLYRQFLSEREGVASEGVASEGVASKGVGWEEPLINFLRASPQVR
jgi:hypothetical protein